MLVNDDDPWYISQWPSGAFGDSEKGPFHIRPPWPLASIIFAMRPRETTTSRQLWPIWRCEAKQSQVWWFGWSTARLSFRWYVWYLKHSNTFLNQIKPISSLWFALIQSIAHGFNRFGSIHPIFDVLKNVNSTDRRRLAGPSPELALWPAPWGR